MVGEVSDMLPACRLGCGGFSSSEFIACNVLGRWGRQVHKLKGAFRLTRFSKGVRTVAAASTLKGHVEEFEGKGVPFNQYVVSPR